jgi:hypothetical protein
LRWNVDARRHGRWMKRSFKTKIKKCGGKDQRLILSVSCRLHSAITTLIILLNKDVGSGRHAYVKSFAFRNRSIPSVLSLSGLFSDAPE